MKELLKEIKHTVVMKNIIWIIGLLLLTNAGLYAQTETSTDSTAVAEPQIMMISPIEAPMAAAAAPGGGGGNPPSDPTGSINASSNTCGDKTLTRTNNPPSGEVWYWQTSASGTNLNDDGTTYDATSSGTYYIRAYRPSNQEWSTGYISKSVTVKPIPAKPTPLQENTKTPTSFKARWNSVSGADSYRLDVATNSSFTNMVSGYNNKTVSGTTNTVSGLDGGDYYYYRVRTYDNGCTSSNSTKITANTTLDTPSAKQENTKTASSFKARWNAVSGTTSYRLDVSTNTGFTTYVSGYNNKAIVGTSDVVSGLNPASTYYYRVRAYSSPYTTSNSSTITANTILDVPSVSQESNKTSSTFDANWGSVSGAASYRLDVATNSGFTNMVSGYNNKTVSGTSHTVTGLAPGTQYYYRVKAYSSVYTSGYSSTITANTRVDPPTALQASCATASSLTAAWSSVTNADEYKLYVSTQSDFSSHVSGYNGTVLTGTSHTVTGLSGGTYYYRLKARNSVNTSVYSNSISVKVITKYNVTGGLICSNSGSLTVGLSDTQSGVEYHLYYNAAPVLVEGTSTIVKMFGTGSAETFTYDADLVGDYEVFAVVNGCSTIMNGEANIVTKPIEVTVLGGGDFCAGSSGVPITLSSAETNVTYELFRNGSTTGQSTTTNSFGNQTISGDYTVKASRNGCEITLAETIVVTQIAPPDFPAESISTNTCGDKILASVNPPDPSTSIFWKWQGTQTDGFDMTPFTTHTIESTGSYYVKSYDFNTGCWSSSKEIVVTVNPFPEDFNMTGLSFSCADGTAITYGLDGSQTGAVYDLYIDNVVIENDVPGTGSALNFTPVTQAATYTVVALKDGCIIGMSGSKRIDPLPTFQYNDTLSYSVDVSTNVCGPKILTPNNYPPSESEFRYFWYGDDQSNPAPVSFQSPITIDSTGSYYVRGLNTMTNCWGEFYQIDVNVTLFPVKQLLSGGGDYCVGEPLPTLDISLSESDVIYKVYKDGVYLAGQDQPGDSLGGALTWSGLTTGSYRVTGYRNSCATDVYGTVEITEFLIPTADAGSDISVFNSDILMLPMSEVSGSEWSSSEATIADNLYNARLDGPGTYAMTYTLTNSAGCSDDDQMDLTVLADPDRISLTSGSRFINTDPQATVQAPTLTAPTGYSYQWYKDGTALTGETSNTLLQPDEVGVYDVEIKTASGYGVRSNAIAIVPLRATDEVNYITTLQPKAAFTEVASLPVDADSVMRKYDFMDDLGRPMQTVVADQSVTGLDMVQPMEYDEYGRNVKSYLPYTSDVNSLFKNDAVLAQADFYTTASNIDQDDYPFSENTYENSPFNRVLKTNAPGEVWAKTAVSDGKPVVFTYSANTANEVPNWEIVNDALSKNGTYAAGTLNKTVTTDENGKQVQEYKNLQGQVVLKKVQIAETNPTVDTDWYQTFYVYDVFNNPRFVIPPQAVVEIGAATTVSASILEQYIFQYAYDERQRMIMKQVPGADSVLMVYDQRDRLVMTQDGNQRVNDQWSFTKYDTLNRPVLTGIIAESDDRETLQSEVNNVTVFAESYIGTGSLMGYDGSGYPTLADSADLLTVTYYDSYDFSDDSHWNLGDFTTQPEARTLVTGSKVKVPGQTEWNEMITIYDDYFRVASSVSLDYQSNRDSLVNEYYSDVLPLVTKTTHIHVSALANDTTTLIKTF
ncbi:MAG: DUF6443 domain-containing protein, partial [Reichenbachiella sp.]|uniref:DUF6443 domain-containing protein n=1 Tax=Reichenbachiella sp. TaxID=2184521 RepID=UPI00326667A5